MIVDKAEIKSSKHETSGCRQQDHVVPSTSHQHYDMRSHSPRPSNVHSG